jgi:hypothetical protein
MYEIVVTPTTSLGSMKFDSRHLIIIILTQSTTESNTIIQNEEQVVAFISKRAAEKDTKGILFISPEDNFNIDDIRSCIHDLHNNDQEFGMVLFIPYKLPPEFEHREDGCVRSFLISPEKLQTNILSGFIGNYIQLAYELAFAYLNSIKSKNIEIIQIGKKNAPEERIDAEALQLLKKSVLIIPHKGPFTLLKRCLLHINQASLLPGVINVCFDDSSYQKFSAGYYDKINKLIKVYANSPANVGPYPARHYSIINTSKEYIFFQDSDDIPVNSRFVKQINELKKRKLDMLGSHELRIDQLEKVITIIRFPLDVSASLNSGSLHPLFHPTSLISKKAYLKTGGFSTDRRFGYDTQFLIRSRFFLQSGNIDDFLYIRFKRPNSLTTSAKTKLGCTIREILTRRWTTDLKLILQNKLDLQDSSLSVQQHTFEYQLIEINAK